MESVGVVTAENQAQAASADFLELLTQDTAPGEAGNGSTAFCVRLWPLPTDL